MKLMTQDELYRLLLDTYKKVNQSEDLVLRDLINEIIRQIESGYI
ncbi:hypothetical protein [Siminovitchia fortis]|nr:hypothetical protein [Siminovitchia fortis]WHY80513.1 hypothetical protein QNH23_11210 [Siminovitchia fortis]